MLLILINSISLNDLTDFYYCTDLWPESKIELSSVNEGSSMTLKVVTEDGWSTTAEVAEVAEAGMSETMLFMASSRPEFHLGSSSRTADEVWSGSSGGVANESCLPQCLLIVTAPESLSASKSASSPLDTLDRLESGLFRES